jgi:hypothetical protein
MEPAVRNLCDHTRSTLSSRRTTTRSSLSDAGGCSVGRAQNPRGCPKFTSGSRIVNPRGTGQLFGMRAARVFGRITYSCRFDCESEEILPSISRKCEWQNLNSGDSSPTAQRLSWFCQAWSRAGWDFLRTSRAFALRRTRSLWARATRTTLGGLPWPARRWRKAMKSGS